MPSGAVGKNGFLRLGFERREERTVLTTIKNGPGPMPAGVVKGADAQKVATYVSQNAGS